MTLHSMTTEQYLQAVLRRVAVAAAEGASYPQWDDKYARKQVAEAWEDMGGVFNKRWNRRVTANELRQVPEDVLYSLGFGNWDDGERALYLIPIWAINYIASGTQLHSIMGNAVIKDVNDIDLDCRGGCLAYGITKEAP